MLQKEKEIYKKLIKEIYAVTFIHSKAMNRMSGYNMWLNRKASELQGCLGYMRMSYSVKEINNVYESMSKYEKNILDIILGIIASPFLLIALILFVIWAVILFGFIPFKFIWRVIRWKEQDK